MLFCLAFAQKKYSFHVGKKQRRPLKPRQFHFMSKTEMALLDRHQLFFSSDRDVL